MHHRKTYLHINFKQNQVSRSVKTVHTNVFEKNANCIHLQLTVRISKIYALHTCTTSYRTLKPIFRSTSLLDIKSPQKEIVDIDGGMDEKTSRTTTIGSFFRKKKKILKNDLMTKLFTLDTKQALFPDRVLFPCLPAIETSPPR